MTRFNFRLQKVLELKERHAQAAAIELRIAEQRANQTGAERDALAALRQEGGEQLAAAHDGSTAGDLQNMSFLLEHIDQRVRMADESADHAQLGVEGAQAVLSLAHQATKALDRLRERQLDEFQHTLRKTDGLHMDALALSRFARHRSHQDES
ncbi:MAG: flagellar export protein FliJ [bacterium]